MIDIRQPIYPWFGSKRRVADVIWRAFGEVDNFVDPFFGTMSVLLCAPWPADRTETVNDADGFVANAWRSIKYAPDETARHSDWIVSETDLEARHYWLVTEGREKLKTLLADPHGYDPEIAGWWLWGQCCWIGAGWCAGDGPWFVNADGQWGMRDAGKGVNRQLPHMRNAGQGVNRKLPHMRNAGQGVNRQRPHLGNAGQGVNRQRPHLGDAGQTHTEHLIERFCALADRLRYVRICRGDWSRVLTHSVTATHGTTAVILDPPYSSERSMGVYVVDSPDVAHAVREWALARGDDRQYRIALCGHEGEHAMPDSWRVHKWSATGGYSGCAKKAERGKANKHLERIWFSPHCVRAANRQGSLFLD